MDEFFSDVETVLSAFKNSCKSFWNGIAYCTLKAFLEQRQHSSTLTIREKCLSNKYFDLSIECYAEVLKEVNDYNASKILIKGNVYVQVKLKQYLFILNKQNLSGYPALSALLN